MSTSRLSVIPLMAAIIPAIALSGEAGYSVIDRIPGPDGSYDYISVDSASRRVFVARGDGVMAIDLATRKVTPTLVAGDGVAAVHIVAGTGLMLSTNGNASTATLFDRNSGAVKAVMPTGKEPDAALYDATSGLAFVMNWGSHDVTFIDVAEAAVVATVPVGGNPEGVVSAGEGRIFVNIEDTAEIVELDVNRREVTRRIALPGCEEPTGLAYDPESRTLIAACHNRTTKLVDAGSGQLRETVEVGQGADGAIFDAHRRLVYVPCFDGTLAVFQLQRDGRAGPVTTVVTRRGARTAALDEETGRLYLPVADYSENPEGKLQPVPGTFAVLVVAP